MNYYYNMEYDVVKSETELSEDDRLELLDLIPEITCDEDMNFVNSFLMDYFNLSEALSALEDEISWGEKE